MSTPYSEIIDRAIFRFADTSIARMSEDGQNYIMKKYLDSAVSDFQNKCHVDLSKRITLEVQPDAPSDLTSSDDADNADIAQPEPVIVEAFEEDLDSEIQEILALGISYYWLSAKVLDSELLKNKLSTKDYQYFSPANLMREIQTLRDSVRKEYRDRIIRYTYDHGDVAFEGV